MTRRRNRSRSASRVRLYRDRANGRCLGVCAGIADYSGLSVTGVRIATVIGACIMTGPVVIGYFILGWVLDDRPRDLYEAPREEMFWRDVRANPTGSARDLRHKFRDIERRLRAAEACVTSPQINLKREIDNL